MPVPKRRHSSQRQAKRRANWKLTDTNLVECPSCHQQKLPHRVCPNCGSYDNRKVYSPKEK